VKGLPPWGLLEVGRLGVVRGLRREVEEGGDDRGDERGSRCVGGGVEDEVGRNEDDRGGLCRGEVDRWWCSLGETKDGRCDVRLGWSGWSCWSCMTGGADDELSNEPDRSLNVLDRRLLLGTGWLARNARSALVGGCEGLVDEASALPVCWADGDGDGSGEVACRWRASEKELLIRGGGVGGESSSEGRGSCSSW
jgi:hypothetical protein